MIAGMVMIAKPKPDMLTPAVQALVGEILTEASREDLTPLTEYIEMIQTSPIVGTAIELKVLIALTLVSDYSNEDEEREAFIRDCLEQMRGSLKMAVAEMLCVQPLGYACSEWAPIEIDGKWMLDAIQIIDPRKYRFRGKKGAIEDLLYVGESGDIVIPYDRVIHLTNQRHISFGSPYGVAECRRALAAHRAWKITIAAALIAAKRRGEPITIGFAPGDEQVRVGVDLEGNPVYVSAPEALLSTLADLENNSVAATSIANRIETIQAADGELILKVLEVLQQLQLMAFLVPESILSATGVGDSNLNTGHRNILNLCVGATVDQIKERLIEDVIRPLLVWNFGEDVEDFGSFPAPKVQEEGAIELFNALINAVYNGAFSAADLDVVNRMRDLAGLPTVTEIVGAMDAVPTDAPIGEDDPAIDDIAIDDIASTFAKAAPKGKKKGAGKKNCDKGLNCGGSCISAKKKCKKDNPSPTVKAKAKSKGGGGEIADVDKEAIAAKVDAGKMSGLPPLDTAKLDTFAAKINELEAANDRGVIELREVRARSEVKGIESSELLALLDRDEVLVADFFSRRREIESARKAAEDILGDWRGELIRTGLSQPEAAALLQKTMLGPSLSKQRNEIAGTLIEFHQITNGAIANRLRAIDKKTDRAYADTAIGFVNPGKYTGPNDYKRKLFHEFAHLAEDMESRQIHNNWVRRRGGDTGDLTKISELTGDKSYGAKEVSTKDAFINPYVGKYYGNPADIKAKTENWDKIDTEVLSMGLEKFIDKSSMLDLYLRDREHFSLVTQFLERKRNVQIQN